MKTNGLLPIISILLLTGVSSCKSVGQAKGEFKEEFGPGELEKFRLTETSYEAISSRKGAGGFLKNKPWVDTYWPLNEKNMAARYFEAYPNLKDDRNSFAPLELDEDKMDSYSEFPDYKTQISNIEGDPRTYRLSPGEKYDLITGNKDMSITKEGWETFDYYTKDYKEDWSWMGICHGWANAAYNEAPPQHHVMVKNKAGKEILFFEGDIRGLLSKVYATNYSSGEIMVGNRCNFAAEQIVTDDFGRIVDGMVEEKGTAYAVYFQDSEGVKGVQTYRGVPYVALSKEPRDGLVFYSVLQSEKSRSSSQTNASKYATMDFFDLNLMKAAIDNRKITEEGVESAIQIFKQCRDLNPAVYHAALFQYYSDDKNSIKKGFVTEITRSAEVWNHPIWGFKSIVSKLYSKAEYSKKENTHVSDRATHIAEVATKVYYISERGPYIEYEDKKLAEFHDPSSYEEGKDFTEATDAQGRGESFSTLSLKYRLEFTLDKKTNKHTLIGGEWVESGRKGVVNKTPDFIWTLVTPPTDKILDLKSGSAKLYDSDIKYSVVRKILDCANDTSKEVKEIEIQQRAMDYASEKPKINYEVLKKKYVECQL